MLPCLNLALSDVMANISQSESQIGLKEVDIVQSTMPPPGAHRVEVVMMMWGGGEEFACVALCRNLAPLSPKSWLRHWGTVAPP